MNRNEGKQFQEYLIACLLIAALLCIGQACGSTFVIITGLVGFLLFIVVAALKGMSMPAILFFLPWSPLMKIMPGMPTAYTAALLLICVIGYWNNRGKVNYYCLIFGFSLIALTLIAKMFDGFSFSSNYMMFVLLLLLVPILTVELQEKASFETLTIAFAFGIATAALTAMLLTRVESLSAYINVSDMFKSKRLSGYYGDPNYYSAHISAVLGGVIVLLLRNRESKRGFFLLGLGIVLMYCGFLSLSKSFILVMGCIFVLCIIRFFRTQDRPKFSKKTLLILAAVIVVVLASGVFKKPWETLVQRFGKITDFSSLTTRRSDIWIAYFEEFRRDILQLLIGKGGSKILVIGRAAHNTPIQMVYQLGIIGCVLLGLWEYCLARVGCGGKKPRVHWLDLSILLVGVFLPWMGLDILFFDEFFLLPLYVIAGVRYIDREEARALEAQPELQS